ncbi:MAG: Ig-like domain-containing protein [Polyangia bacterium]
MNHRGSDRLRTARRQGPLTALLLIATVLGAVRCSSEGPASPSPQATQEEAGAGAVQLMLSPSNPQIARGTAQQFSLRVRGPDGRTKDVTARGAWSVAASEGGVVHTSSDGLVALEAPGRYQVTVTYEGQALRTPIVVTTAALRSLSVTPTAPKVAKGLTQQFKATASFTDGTTQDVTALAGWSVKDVTGTRVATVNSTGLATAKAEGKARFTARYQTSSASATLEVTAAAVTALSVAPPDPTIAKGTEQAFAARATFSDGTVQDVTALADWVISDVMGSGVASIDGTGTALGEAAGQARVSAEYGGKTGEATLTVTPAAVVSLAVSPTAASIDKGSTQKFTATARLSDGSAQDVTAAAAWTATDVTGTAVASVDASGTAKGQSAGLSRIGCAYRGTTASATLEVKPGPLPPLASKVDLLLVIDNSPSMSPKQKALGASIGRIVRSLQQLDIDYHVGVISTDVGTNVAAGTPWGGIGSCDTFEGDDGVLQAAACSSRISGSSDARTACATLCPDSKFVPTDGLRYIRGSGGMTNVPTALEVDPMTGKTVDTGPEKALRCIGLIGDGGCGVESPLEAIKRALDGHRSDNDGFLRPDALLTVLVITDEDDCSVQLARRRENNPFTRDCSGGAPEAYDCYNIDYRCFASSVQCDQPMTTAGAKTNCKERPGSYLEPVDKYASFLSALRPAARLVVSGIWTRPSVSEGGKVEIARTAGGTATPFLNRAPGTGASCAYAADPNLIGQAQLRLSSFAGKLPGSLQSSVCDIDNYGAALDRVVAAIKTKLGK